MPHLSAEESPGCLELSFARSPPKAGTFLGLRRFVKVRDVAPEFGATFLVDMLAGRLRALTAFDLRGNAS